MEGVSNCLLNTYLYTHKLVQLSPHITEAFVCSGQIFIQMLLSQFRELVTVELSALNGHLYHIPSYTSVEEEAEGGQEPEESVSAV